MCKRLVCFVLFVLVTGLAGNATGAEITWDGDGTDSLWSTAANWAGDTVPTASDDAIIEMDPGAIIDDSVKADAANVRIADAEGSTGRVVMTGGTLTVHQTGSGGPGLWIANRGTGYFDMSGGTITAEHVYLPRNAPGQSYMTMSGGTITTGQSLTLGLHDGEYGELNISGGTINVGTMFRCPDGGQAVLNMRGGTINVSGTFFIIRRGSSGGTTSGHVQLDGGTITVDDFEMDAQNTGRPATMDITNGTLVINGDKVDKIKTYVAKGWITAFGSGGSGVNVGLAGAKTVVSAGLSWNPSPKDGAEDVPVDVILSWSPGFHAVKHDVYFGTSFDDVNNATATSDPAGVYKGSQIVNTYQTSGLEMSRTYYWRIDDISAENTISKGSVWRFTTEPFAYPITAENISATASSSNSPDEGPENTVNGSGLSDGKHSSTLTDMWLSETGEPGSAWIQYEFDRSYSLHQMQVWNYNGSTILINYGLKDVTIEYSTDAANWTPLGGVTEFAQASGADDYAHNTTVDFDGVLAKYVRITANSNWGGGGVFNRYGLSEVRFLYMPLRAREPQPMSGATNVDPDLTLRWRAGRKAAEHHLSISTDEQEVINDTAPVSIVTEARYPISLDLGQTYYWKVNEVNMAETPSMLEGDVWNFTTRDFIVVDDFESYNDMPVEEGGNPVYLTWVDGYDNPATNGSTIGYTEPFEPSMESGAIHSGALSVPFMYDNNMKISEAVRTIDPPQDWTRHGTQVLSLYFHGVPENSVEQMYVKVNGSRIVYDGDPADIQPTEIEHMERGMWKLWNIDLAALGVDLQNITELAIGFGDENNLTADGSGIVFFDDIRLYPSAPEPPEEIWLEAEAATTMGANWKIFDDPDSSGGRHIGSEDGDGDDNSTPPGVEWIASYDFSVAGGTYKMLFRAQQANSDSFWVRIPTATSQNLEDQDLPGTGWVRFDAIDVPRGDWGWDEVYSELSRGMQVFEVMNYTLPAGAHTLEIAKREDGVFLDAILITNDVD